MAYRKRIPSEVLRGYIMDGLSNKEIHQRTGAENLYVRLKELRQQILKEVDLLPFDTLRRRGMYRVLQVNEYEIVTKELPSEFGRTLCKEVRIPVREYLSGKSGFHKLDIPPVKVMTIEEMLEADRIAGIRTGAIAMMEMEERLYSGKR